MADGPAIVRGVVRDASGTPLPGARVMVAEGPGSLPDVAALTDAQGAFTLTAGGAGRYRIRAVADGHEPIDVEVTLAAGQSRLVELKAR